MNALFAKRPGTALPALALVTLSLSLPGSSSAQTVDALNIDIDGRVGVGTSTPESALHVVRGDGTARVQVTETNPGPSMPFQGQAQGLVRFELNDEASGERWRFTNAGSKFAINNVGADSPGTEMSVFKNGDMTITGLLTENSDADAKQDIVPVSAQDILARIAALPISEWSYIDAPDYRHIGPMAQDFHAAFGLGRNEKGISTLDTSGVALAGIQALKAENDRLAARNLELESRVQRQASRIQAQNERLRALEARQQHMEHVLMRLSQEAAPLTASTASATN